MFHLSSPQKSVYEMEKYFGGSIAVICGSVLLNGRRNVTELKDAVNEIYRLNEALRIHVFNQDGAIWQEVCNYHEQNIEVLKFKSKESLDIYAEKLAREPVALSGPLCSIQVVILPDRFGLLAKCHHLVGDAWTLTLIASQLNEILAGKEPEVYPYSDYLSTEMAYAKSNRREKDQTFFNKQFKVCPEVTYISDRLGESCIAHRETFHIDENQASQIKTYAANHHVSPFVLFLTAFAVYFSRVKGNVEQFYLGTPILNRSNFREKNTMGMFINTVPVMAHVEYNHTFADILATMQDRLLSVMRHQRFNYSDILTDIRQEYGFTERLLDVMISWQNAAVVGAAATSETTWYHSGAQAESLQIHIDDRDSKGSFRIHFDYRIDKLTGQEVHRIYRHLMVLLLDAIEHDGKKPEELTLLSDNEKRQILNGFNNTVADYPKDKCIHQLFEEQASKIPEKTALVFGDRKFSYEELNGLANGLAWQLKVQGVKRGDIVAILAKRSYELVVAILAIFKVGAAYLPIAPDYPLERIETIVKDSNCVAVLTYDINCTACKSIDLKSNIKFNACNPENLNDVSDVCAVIYTSGSTGQPKGTLLCHRGLVNYTYANDALYTGGSSVVGFSIYTFDAFFLDTISPMLRGIPAIMATEAQQFQQSDFEKLIKEHPNCNLFITPAKLEVFFQNRIDGYFYENIHNMCIGGEVFPPEFIDLFSGCVNIFNVYGPTECSMWTLEFPVSGQDISIGHPLANTQVYIVDQYLRPVPIGVTGELCIAGAGVGAGYLNRPELTKQKFIENPFGPGKLYRSGDLAYWREDGNIIFVGRNDFQVKIRGLRVELGEIESNLSAISGISQAVVAIQKDKNGRQLICAFYKGIESVKQDDIKAALRKNLPRYMMPHRYISLDTFPLTPSGKVDRQALPDVNLIQVIANEECSRPESGLEQQLASLMEQVLDYYPIGRNDNFFELGGDSLKAIDLLSKAHNDGIYFSLQNLFDHPTVQSLAMCVQEEDRPRDSYREVDFTEIDKLLSNNRLDNEMPSEKAPGNMLLTGVTGFLGIHILADYLNYDTGTAYCLVRGANQLDSENRLSNLLDFYFGGKYKEQLGHRIRILCGDLTKDYLGLAEQDYRKLQTRIDTVVNSSATVKHFGSYSYFYEINVESVERLIAFCQSSHSRLVQISTLSVSGYGFENIICEGKKNFDETCLYIGQNLENVYARSKFEAERAVMKAVCSGLKAHIFRMGNLTNRRSDGVFQINYKTNAAAKRMKALVELGAVPDYLFDSNLSLDFTPVDEAARAVMLLVRHVSDKKTVFHINSTMPLKFNNFIDYLRKLGFPMKVVSDADFAAILHQAEKKEDTCHIFEAFINYMDTNNRLNYSSNIHIENSFTAEHLRHLGFHWGEIELGYLRKYVSYFKKIGYWS